MSAHSKFALFILLVPATLSIAAGQSYFENNPAPLSEHIGGDTRPTWEQWPPPNETAAFRAREEAGAVSVKQLRRPLKGKGRDLIEKAERLVAKGKIAEALAVLEKALEITAAQPYALSILGTQHLKMGMVDQAIVELEQAAQTLEGSALIHNNLAFALGVKGQNDRAEKEARKGLQIEPANPKTRYILGALLIASGQHDEAIYHLKLAASEIDGARHLLESTLAARNPPMRVQASPVMSFQGSK